MKYTVYRKVEMDENGTKEPVNYVGVHPLMWHDHPKQPELGFVEIEIDLPDDEEIDKQVRITYNDNTHRWIYALGIQWFRNKIENQLK